MIVEVVRGVLVGLQRTQGPSEWSLAEEWQAWSMSSVGQQSVQPQPTSATVTQDTDYSQISSIFERVTGQDYCDPSD